MNDAGNNLKNGIYDQFPNFDNHIGLWFTCQDDDDSENAAEDENHDDNDDEKYPSLNSSEPLGLWCVASHRVEDVHQHQEQGHQQCHST